MWEQNMFRYEEQLQLLQKIVQNKASSKAFELPCTAYSMKTLTLNTKNNKGNQRIEEIMKSIG